LSDVERGGDTRRDVLADGGGAAEDVREFMIFM
jgi:hypothetical protein